MPTKWVFLEDCETLRNTFEMIAAYKDGDEVEVESEDERQMLPLFEVVQLLFIPLIHLRPAVLPHPIICCGDLN